MPPTPSECEISYFPQNRVPTFGSELTEACSLFESELASSGTNELRLQKPFPTREHRCEKPR